MAAIRLPAMYGNVQDVRVVGKHGLSAIAVMNVIIDNENALDAQRLLRIRCRQGDIVEDTISARHGRFGVMARRSNRGKAIVQLLPNHLLHQAT